MKELYYSTLIDKNGNKLTSSYINESSYDKYGQGGTLDVNVYKAELKNGQMTISDDEDAEGYVLRGKLVNNGEVIAEKTLPYVLWAKRGDEWFETPFNFDSFGTANSTMKSLIRGYQAMVIVFVEGDEQKPKQFKQAVGGLSLTD